MMGVRVVARITAKEALDVKYLTPVLVGDVAVRCSYVRHRIGRDGLGPAGSLWCYDIGCAIGGVLGGERKTVFEIAGSVL